MKRLAFNVLKFALSFGIVAYLVFEVSRTDPTSFERLANEPKNWGMLATAAGCLMGALALGWTRWCLLGRLLGLKLQLRDAWRFGYLAYMLDFLALGTLGGDIAKAVLLGREQRGRWGATVASVALDRVIGLFTLCIVAAVAIAASDLSASTPQIRAVAQLMFAAGVATTACVLLLFVPRVQDVVLAEFPRRMPRVGRRLAHLATAIRAYGQRREAVAGIVVLSLGVPLLNILGFYFIAKGIPIDAPPLRDHFIIIPPAMLSGAVPLPMEALGVLEYTLHYLYAHSTTTGGGQGLMVALTYRVVTISVILLGTPFYLGVRRDVHGVLAEAARADAPA
jgi:uncharacterized protein (TIRG00374 family)